MNKWLYERCRNNHPCPKGLNNDMPLQIHKKNVIVKHNKNTLKNKKI